MTVPPDKLRQALSIVAQLVARDGAKFLPVFLRMENEVAMLDKNAEALTRAMRLCEMNKPQKAIFAKASARPETPPPSP